MSGTFSSYFDHHLLGFWAGIALVCLVLLLLLAVLSRRHRRLAQRFEQALSAVEGQSVPAMLTEYLTLVRRMAAQTEQLHARVEDISTALPDVITHVGLVRFTPFHDTGGDHSFCLALLNGRGDGVVLSALHARRDSKLYAKPIRNRTSSYVLTEEEKRAIRDSILVEDMVAAGTTPAG